MELKHEINHVTNAHNSYKNTPLATFYKLLKECYMHELNENQYATIKQAILYPYALAHYEREKQKFTEKAKNNPLYLSQADYYETLATKLRILQDESDSYTFTSRTPYYSYTVMFHKEYVHDFARKRLRKHYKKEETIEHHIQDFIQKIRPKYIKEMEQQYPHIRTRTIKEEMTDTYDNPTILL